MSLRFRFSEIFLLVNIIHEKEYSNIAKFVKMIPIANLFCPEYTLLHILLLKGIYEI